MNEYTVTIQTRTGTATLYVIAHSFGEAVQLAIADTDNVIGINVRREPQEYIVRNGNKLTRTVNTQAPVHHPSRLLDDITTRASVPDVMQWLSTLVVGKLSDDELELVAEINHLVEGR